MNYSYLYEKGNQVLRIEDWRHTKMNVQVAKCIPLTNEWLEGSYDTTTGRAGMGMVH